jgi:hypothetical protein
MSSRAAIRLSDVALPSMFTQMGEGASTSVLVTTSAAAGAGCIARNDRIVTHRSPSLRDGGPVSAANVVNANPADAVHA